MILWHMATLYIRWPLIGCPKWSWTTYSSIPSKILRNYISLIDSSSIQHEIWTISTTFNQSGRKSGRSERYKYVRERTFFDCNTRLLCPLLVFRRQKCVQKHKIWVRRTCRPGKSQRTETKFCFSTCLGSRVMQASRRKRNCVCRASIAHTPPTVRILMYNRSHPDWKSNHELDSKQIYVLVSYRWNAMRSILWSALLQCCCLFWTSPRGIVCFKGQNIHFWSAPVK